MSPDKALSLLHDALERGADYIVSEKARIGRQRLNLSLSGQIEILRALKKEHFQKDAAGKKEKKAGWHYFWSVSSHVPLEDGEEMRECTIFVKFRIPPEEDMVDITSFCEDGDVF